MRNTKNIGNDHFPVTKTPSKHNILLLQMLKNLLPAATVYPAGDPLRMRSRYFGRSSSNEVEKESGSDLWSRSATSKKGV